MTRIYEERLRNPSLPTEGTEKRRSFGPKCSDGSGDGAGEAAGGAAGDAALAASAGASSAEQLISGFS